MKIFILTMTTLFFSLTQAAEKPIKIILAYPATGSVIAGQIGMVLERTDTFKIYGFDATVKSMSADEEKAGIVEGKLDVIITTESNYVALTEKNAKVVAFSTLGLEDNFQIVNVINKAYSAKNPKVTEKLNGVFVDAFYYLNNHKNQVNKWYADKARMTPQAVDTASKVNKNYNAKRLSEISVKI